MVDGAEVYLKWSNPVNKEGKLLHANWKHNEKQIWLYVDNWEDKFKTPEYTMWIINHELIHSVIDKILNEDKLWPQGIWTHFPFACGIDDLFGISFFYMHINPAFIKKGCYILTGRDGKRTYLGLSFMLKIFRLKFSVYTDKTK